ncbi:MAG: DUF924 family protein [Gammaproteobacteria bacterium]|nr:DUF924 family protein [Gammaproteobacteria bacterium]MBT5223635.1 DUF924 family protein [Gammaproteobacteria bacterium]MBT5825945.1 DUF924 family protein [Gammaproteobacteria bacterium]MBT5967414.1 DUF924 family protein [Gammaproteobacteria bacterium]MBT6419388.1 DUF924 family protein [Gammaproteobacteria bacterium]
MTLCLGISILHHYGIVERFGHFPHRNEILE